MYVHGFRRQCRYKTLSQLITRYAFLHDKADTFASLLYIKLRSHLSVCLFLVMLITRSSQLGLTQDLVYVIAVASGMSKYVFISL